MLHDTLWDENAELVRRCLEHAFVRGLADGTLDCDVFRRYVAQDAFFLRAFLRAYALAAAKCDDFERARIFHELMTGVLDELELHASYSATLDIDLDHVKPYVATARLAKGEDLVTAVKTAKRFITAAIQNSPGLGQGYGPVDMHARTDV